VQDLLDIARTAELDPARVDLAQLAAQEVERLAAAGRFEGREVRCESGGPVEAWVDGKKLRQVIGNLLTNAVEASAPGGVVQVRVHETGGEREIEVLDSGPGVPPEARARLFEPFFTTKAEGTGLGLAICRAIVEAHGGRISLENRGEGGARAAIRLPERGRADV